MQAGDLASHVYNTWLAELIRAGHAPGLEIAAQNTNVLFDLLLGLLVRGLGPGPAQRIAVGLAVLVFAWGAFAFASTVAGRRVWDLLPCIAMLSYGWVFHIGFFNFYLGLGLCFWALAISWNRGASRLALAAPLLLLAWFAHALPVVWAISVMAYAWLWRGLTPGLRWIVFLLALALLALLGAGIELGFQASRTTVQAALVTGADQLVVFDGKYAWLSLSLLAVWLVLLAKATRAEGIRAVCSRLELQLFVLCAAGVLIVPGAIFVPGYGHALVYISQRMSMTAAVMACAVVAPRKLDGSRLAFALLAVVFFAVLFRDERILNRFEDRLDAAIASLPEGQRVIFGVRTPKLRVNALAHMIDRACIGRCYSYGNYEPSTGQFRVRIVGRSPIVVASHTDSAQMQLGGYTAKQEDLPLYQVVVDAPGTFSVRPLEVGERSRRSEIDIFPPLF